MISSQEYVNRAAAWATVFKRLKAEAIRNMNGSTATLQIDDVDCEQLLTLCERVIETEQPAIADRRHRTDRIRATLRGSVAPAPAPNTTTGLQRRKHD